MQDDGLCKTIEAYDNNVDAHIKRTCSLEMGVHIDKFVGHLRGNNVLSVGCGYGKDEAVLSAKGLKITGIDLSSKLLDEAKRRVPNASFLMMDMRSLSFENDSFDGVYCCASLHHLQRSDTLIALNEMHRVLVPNGILYVGVKEGAGEEWRQLGLEQVRETFFAKDEFGAILKSALFDIIEFYRTDNKIIQSKPWLNYFCRK